MVVVVGCGWWWWGAFGMEGEAEAEVGGRWGVERKRDREGGNGYTEVGKVWRDDPKMGIESLISFKRSVCVCVCVCV